MSYNFTKEQIKQAYDLLPADVQEFYSAEKTSTDIFSIGTKYGLHVDAMGKLGSLVGLAISGLVPLIDFNKELINRTGVAPDTANLIIYDLNQEVFGPIRESMLAMVKQKVQAETARANPAMSAPPAMTMHAPTAGTTTPPTKPPTQSPTNSPTPGVGQMKPKSYGTGGVFSVPKSEVDVKAKTSDNIIIEPVKIPTDPYHEPVN
ncbi:MAG: hypothetical protein NTV48_00380 [Candidatus Vogelbacteria bacterium]|nr:hypothetical protein [Candidatus Vogelbacteria bacterium]